MKQIRNEDLEGVVGGAVAHLLPQLPLVNEATFKHGPGEGEEAIVQDPSIEAPLAGGK